LIAIKFATTGAIGAIKTLHDDNIVKLNTIIAHLIDPLRDSMAHLKLARTLWCS